MKREKNRFYRSESRTFPPAGRAGSTRFSARPSVIGPNCPSTATVQRNRSSPAALVSRTTQLPLQSRLTTSSTLGRTICHSSRVGVRAATAKIVTAEELGGAEVHSRVSGVTHHYALDDRHALGIARLIVGNLNRTKNVSLDLRQPCEPVYPAEEIYGVIPPDTRRPYEVREVIARIVDGRCSPADPARASRRSRSPQRSR